MRAQPRSQEDAPCDPRREHRVLVLGGPTASGKTELAAELARSVGGAVVCADSRQVYRGLEIGTAQPDRRLRELAPHFMAGFLSPAAEYSAGRYADDARRVIAALAARGVPVVLCGGTGLYLRAALGGLFKEDGAGRRRARPTASGGSVAAEPRRLRAALARRWETEGAARLHAELARVDPRLARRVRAGDRQRVLRGLAFHASAGRPLSAAWTEEPGQAPAGALRFRLDLAAPELEARIAARLESMLREGLVDEARALFDRYAADPPLSLNAVGYPELFRHFRGEVSLDDALHRILLRSRQYAKRQRTWFRNQDGYAPLPVGSSALPALLEAWRERRA